MADVAEQHQDARELPVRQHNKLISQQFAIAYHLPQHPCHQLCHRPPDDRPERRRSLIGRFKPNIQQKLTESHSAIPATSRQSAASTKMRSELSLKAAHQNYSLADRRPLIQPNRHCQGRQELFWHNCAPVTADSLVSTCTKSTRQCTTIATTVVSHLMTPTTFLTALRSRPH